MENFPAFLALQGQKVVIAGGDELAARKARLLVSAHADVVMIAEMIDTSVRREFDGRMVFHERAIEAADFKDSRLAIIAAEDEALQKRLVDQAHQAGALVNVVDVPSLCDFTTPSIIDRDDVVVAISTNGKAPVLGRNLREAIERMLPGRLGELVKFAGSWRPSVKKRFGSKTRSFWEHFFSGPIAEQVLAGDEEQARESMLKIINHNDATPEEKTGVVHIIGAGPGDPELLTIRAHRLLQTCDVILYDRLVGEEVLALARRDADRVFVGKAKSNHSLPQEEIQQLMISFAREGKTVVRLKGGDPFVFGRGGEELDALREAGIPTYVTPGITAATGCAAAAGMALTHRDHAQAVTFVTGHARTNEEPDLNWQALADLKNTLVIYMGVGKSGIIAKRLMDHGRASDTPVAVIENGSRPNQIIVRGVLSLLPDLLEQACIEGPAILVVGDVAQLADEKLLHAATQNISTQLGKLSA